MDFVSSTRFERRRTTGLGTWIISAGVSTLADESRWLFESRTEKLVVGEH